MLGFIIPGRQREMDTSAVYEKLTVEENAEDEQHQCPKTCNQSQRRNYIRHILIDLTVLCVLSVIVGCWSYAQKRHVSQSLSWESCGNTSAQAKAAGCIYEPMQRSWIPRACHVEEATYDYQPFDDREWFSDDKLKNKLTDEELRQLREGELTMAYTPFYHNEHCVYCWRKLAIAVERRLPMIDSKTANFHHSTHCAHLLMEEVYDVGTHNTEDYDHQLTFSPLMFQTCVPLQWA